MLNSVKKLQIFYAKSPEISLATSPVEQAVHGVLFTFNLRTFGYRLLLERTKLEKAVLASLTDRVVLTNQMSTTFKGCKNPS